MSFFSNNSKVNQLSASLADRMRLAYVINNAQYGIHNDGTNSQATTDGINNAIQYAVSNGYTHVVLTDGTYLIKPIKDGWMYPAATTSYLYGINLSNLSNLTLELTNNCVLKCDVTSCYNGQVININTSNNITVKGGTIDGNRENHIYTQWNTTTATVADTHENFFNINIAESTNVVIESMNLKMAVGDAVFIDGFTLDSVTVKNCVISDSRRNNISYINGANVNILNCKIINAGSNLTNSQGTAPRFGIDIEGYKTTGYIENPTKAVIDNCNFINNMNGSVANYDGDNVIITNCKFDTVVMISFGSQTIVSNNIFTGNGTGYAIDSVDNATYGVTGKNVIQGNIISGYDTAFSVRNNDLTIRNNTVRNCNAFAIINSAVVNDLVIRNNNSNTVNYFLSFTSVPTTSMYLIENNHIVITGTTAPAGSVFYSITGLSTSNWWCVFKNNNVSALAFLYNVTGNKITMMGNHFVGMMLSASTNVGTSKLVIFDNKFSQCVSFMNMSSGPAYFEFSNNHIEFLDGTSSFTGFAVTINQTNQTFIVSNNRFVYNITTALSRGIGIYSDNSHTSSNVYITQNTLLLSNTASVTNSIYCATDQYGAYKLINNIMKGTISAGANITQSGNVAV